jgi:casein kinase I family protein HRR25
MLIGGKYQVIKELTKTTLSIVYECEHIIKKDKVIVKIEKQKRLLQKEAEIYLYLKKSKVKIPIMKGMGIHEDSAYLVLSQLKESLLTYTGQIHYIDFFKELYYLHEVNIIHRDIKPQNFLIGFKDDLYLIDFGLSCFQTNVPMNRFIGNKRYASPVCFDSEYVYHFKDDVISLIYMLLDLTYGYLPWDKDELPRKDYDFIKYYPSNILLDLYTICLNTFSYKLLFERLSGGIDSGHTESERKITII